MRRSIIAVCASLLLAANAWADGAPGAIKEITEEDGSPSCFGYQLKFANGTVTDNADGTCSQAGGGSGDITSVGDVASGAAFDGTQGTILTFNNASGDQTLSFDNTTQDFELSDDLTLTNATPHVKLADSTAGDEDWEIYADGDAFIIHNVTLSKNMLNVTNSSTMSSTWGNGQGFTWTLDSGSGTDPTIAFGSSSDITILSNNFDVATSTGALTLGDNVQNGITITFNNAAVDQVITGGSSAGMTINGGSIATGAATRTLNTITGTVSGSVAGVNSVGLTVTNTHNVTNSGTTTSVLVNPTITNGSSTITTGYGVRTTGTHTGAGTLTEYFGGYFSPLTVSAGAVTRNWAAAFTGNIFTTGGDLDIGDDTPHLEFRDEDDNTAYQLHLDATAPSPSYAQFALWRGTDAGNSAFAVSPGTPMFAFDSSNAFYLPQLVNCNTIDTNALGKLTCGSDEGGVGGGDSITVNSSAATDPDFANGDVDWTLTGGNSITATVACTGCIDATDMATDSVAADEIATGAVGTAEAAGLDISADTNLTAGDNLTLTDDDLDLDAAVTIATSLASPILASTNADTADAGSIRLGNAELIEREAAPAGTDETLTLSSGENFQFSGPLEIDASDAADAEAIRLDNAEGIGWEASPAGTDCTLKTDASEILQSSCAFTTAGILAATGGLTVDSTTETNIEGALDTLTSVTALGTITTGGWNLADSVTALSVYTGTTSLEETTAANDSGAFIVGINDEFTYSAGTTVQDVVDDLDAAISGVAAMRFLPQEAVFDDGAPPSLTVVESTGTGTARRFVADFDPATDQILYWSFVAPQAIPAGNWTLVVSWFSNDTGANEDAIWYAQMSCTTEADTDSMAEDAAGSANTAAENVNATEANRLIQTSITLSNLDSVAAGDFCTIAFGRDADDTIGDADNDGLSSDARLLALEVRTP